MLLLAQRIFQLHPSPSSDTMATAHPRLGWVHSLTARQWFLTPKTLFFCNHSMSAPLLNPLFPIFPRTWGYSGRTKPQKNYLSANLWASSCPALPLLNLARTAVFDMLSPSRGQIWIWWFAHWAAYIIIRKVMNKEHSRPEKKKKDWAGRVMYFIEASYLFMN